MARTAKNPMLDTLALIKANPEKFGQTAETLQLLTDAVMQSSVSETVTRKFDGSQTDAEVEWFVSAIQIAAEILSLRCKASGTSGLRRVGMSTEFGKIQVVLDVTNSESSDDE